MKLQFEKFVDIYEEVLPVIFTHWDEVPFGKWKEIQPIPNLTEYLMIENAGFFKILTARENGKIVGYFAVTAGNMLHHEGLTHVATDVIYIDPAYRRTGLFAEMLEIMVTTCRDCGITFFNLGINANYDFSSKLEGDDWVLTEKILTRKL